MELETIKISKEFAGKCALSDITLNVESGKILAIIGPSGSGKTTLLRIINMLEAPSSGVLKLNGKNPYEQSRAERYDLRTQMALMFQNPSLFQRSVEQNVAYALKIRYVHPNKIEKEVAKVLKLVGLQTLRRQFAPTLSAGEAQRVSFARDIVFQPKLLLLDEFTANLDPANVKLLEEGVVKYQKKTDATIILATHNLFQAKRLADEVVFIFDGRIIERGKKEEFFSNPQNPLTSSFLSGELIC